MKKITLLFAILLNFLIFGQPVLTSSDINPLNIAQNAFSASSENLGIGNAGANATWDFSSLILTSQGFTSNTSVATAPFASAFPTANFFINSISDNDNSYGYYNLTTNKIEVVGISDDTGVSLNFLNPLTIFEFPLSFGNSFTDDYQVNQINAIESTTTTYDAYGTLITPFGTYNDVLRLKQINNLNFISYSWFKLNPYVELQSANLNPNNSQITYRVNQPLNLSTTQNQIQNQFSIAPNPTAGNLTIKSATFSESQTFINVYDVLGNEIMRNNKIDNDSKNIDLSNLSAGLYFIKITDVNNAVLYTEKIIKK